MPLLSTNYSSTTFIAKIIMFVGFFMAGLSLLIVPFDIVERRSGENPRMSIGHHLILSPPAARDYCLVPRSRYARNNPICVVEAKLANAFTQSLGFLLLTGAGLFGTFAIGSLSNYSTKPAQHFHRHNDELSPSLGTSSHTPKPTETSLFDGLKSHFGEDFEISGGEGTLQSPLVITSKENYVALEVAIISFITEARGLEFELKEQSLFKDQDRHIDQIIIKTRPARTPTWTSEERYYFDVTAGFNALLG